MTVGNLKALLNKYEDEDTLIFATQDYDMEIVSDYQEELTVYLDLEEVIK